MKLLRKSDGLVISDQITDRSGWYDDATVVSYKTIGGVRRRQTQGVGYKMQDITMAFSGSYPNSSSGGYNALVDAARNGTTLTLTDAAGNDTDVKVDTWPGKDGVSRWSEVRTKDIRFVSVSLYNPAYYA